MVARLVRHKGQELFLRACEQAGVPAVCIGEGPDQAELQQRFPRARFTGQLAREQVQAEMLRARALVLPSLWYETQGLVVDEAAALGLPAIVSDACAATDAVQHGRNGLVFRSGDADALANALQRLHEDGSYAQALGRQAFERFWRDPPTPANHARELLQAYAGVLARAAARRHAGPRAEEAVY
ncbi:glycosyltransferase family 4 protein [Paucibacter soli]